MELHYFQIFLMTACLYALEHHVDRLAEDHAHAQLLAVGIALLPLPGPGTLIILGGLTMLGTEFPVAKRIADRGWKGVGRVTGFFRKQT